MESVTFDFAISLRAAGAGTGTGAGAGTCAGAGARTGARTGAETGTGTAAAECTKGKGADIVVWAAAWLANGWMGAGAWCIGA